ncbi:MAG: sulfotransferase, partial [Paracoccaceae bacterium]
MNSNLKVINLGLPKSGTTTLGKALSRAGLRVADWRIRDGNPNATACGFVGNLMYHGYFTSGDPLEMMPNFDAFSEIDIVRHGLNLWPQTDWGLISAIQDSYPGARFVLTHRDARKISDSMLRWSNMGRTRLPENQIPGLPQAFGETDDQRVRWIEGHLKFCRQ